jgi:phenylalanyl-tRNA synthetase beta chain
VCSINLSAAALHTSEKRTTYIAPAIYPEVVRDLALVVAKSISHESIVAALAGADSLVSNVALFDVFVGGTLPEGMKSAAYHITYSRPDRTLTSEEVDLAERNIIEQLQKKFQAEIRK